MFATLSILLFAVLFLFLYGIRLSADVTPSDWRGTFLQTCLIWGTLTTIFTELLGLFGLITLPWLAVMWCLALGITLFLGWRKHAFTNIWVHARSKRTISLGWIDGFLLAVIAGIAMVLFIIAWTCPPNTTDSLQYHMSRVVHWAQNGSLRHYATYFEPQLFNPIWAETAILNFRVLTGDDRLANMVQWFSMIGCLIGTSALASLLGVKRRGQILAMAFVASIPMGILQATSTQTNYVVSFWLVCLLYLVLLSKWRRLEALEWMCLALATGLGILTKGTFYLFAFPILLWFFIPFLMKEGLRRTFTVGLGFAGVVVFLNLGFWVRNVLTFGSPLGPKEWVTLNTQASLRPQQWISGVVWQTALNLPTPRQDVNTGIISTVRAIDELLGIEDSEFSFIYSWNHEDLAGNALHLLLTMLSLGIFLVAWRRTELSLTRRYALVVFCSYLFFSALISFDIFGVRHHLSFFVMWGAAFGAAITMTRLRKLTSVAALFLLLVSVPYVLLNRSRPLVDQRPRTMTSSIFDESQAVILMANWVSLRAPFFQTTEAVRDLGCQQVGIKIDSHDLEYPYWWLLDAPQSGIRIEVVDTYPRLERYLDRDFKPCVIMCTLCGDKQRLYGLPRIGTFASDDLGIALFAGSSYTPDEDG